MLGERRIRCLCGSLWAGLEGGLRILDPVADASAVCGRRTKRYFGGAAAAGGRRAGAGKTISIDATTLEANAAMKNIVRRDTGQSYDDYLKELAKAAGIENPTREQLARARPETEEKGSNK